MKFDASKLKSLALPVGAAVLTMVASFVSGKNQDAKLDKMVSKKVSEAMESQVKGS